MNDKAMKRLLVIVLVLAAAVLGILLLSWLGMAGMMAGGLSGGMMGTGMGQGMTVLALLVIAAVVAALVWVLRTSAQGPVNGGESS